MICFGPQIFVAIVEDAGCPILNRPTRDNAQADLERQPVVKVPGSTPDAADAMVASLMLHTHLDYDSFIFHWPDQLAIWGS